MAATPGVVEQLTALAYEVVVEKGALRGVAPGGDGMCRVNRAPVLGGLSAAVTRKAERSTSGSTAVAFGQ
ncbi:hypothetical protein ACFXDH_09015 [Streptomyces sp. NPDC059467]|uniref:hypothetical protein n=1 Tax=Streptomyces sp. NPDC059467 TaxID=3346844 RepID=UPI0036B8A294